MTQLKFDSSDEDWEAVRDEAPNQASDSLKKHAAMVELETAKLLKTAGQLSSTTTDQTPHIAKQISSVSVAVNLPSNLLVVRQDNKGVQWIAFEYYRDRVTMEYTIRCDIESVNVELLSPEFKTENCIFPQACCTQDSYRGDRFVYETECNTMGWALVELNPCLRGKLGLIHRAVESWREATRVADLHKKNKDPGPTNFSGQNLTSQDYQHQLNLLEQQCKKRLASARLEQDNSRGSLPNRSITQGDIQHPLSNQALQDYKLQLNLLEQQNKERLAAARLEQDNPRNNPHPHILMQHEIQDCPSPPLVLNTHGLASTVPPTPKQRFGARAPEKYQLQLMLLEFQNKLRLIIARRKADGGRSTSIEEDKFLRRDINNWDLDTSFQGVEEEFLRLWKLAMEQESSYDHPGHEVGNSIDSHLNFVSDYIVSISETLRPISLKIHDNPELNYEEFIAHETLVEFMKTRAGWDVNPSAYGIPTAFIAVYDSGREGPVISYNAEYDALTGIGHACGHNLIATASLAAALASGEAVDYFGLSGKVILFGTPAEEGGGGKIKLLDAGAYSDHKVDINLITHPGKVADSVLVRTNAYLNFKVEYFGKEAHAAAAPWEGINALDALITAYNSLSVLRQQTMAGDIIQGHITDGGSAPNIIHAYASGIFVVRALTKKRLAVLRQKVENCFIAGAQATGAKLKITNIGSYDDHVPNLALGKVCREVMNKMGGSIPEQEMDLIKGATQASTDQGNISYAMPSLSLGFAIESVEGPHNPGFTKSARTMQAHGAALRAGKGLAVTGLQVLADEKLLEAAKREFEEMKESE